MSRPLHYLQHIDDSGVAGVCKVCGPIDVVRTNGGVDVIRSICGTVWRERQSVKRWRYKNRHRRALRERLELMTCERCGFVAEDLVQLDVDHIIPKSRGGSSRADNLQVLCSNCHRLKTLREGVWLRTHDSEGRRPTDPSSLLT
jgi:hypothetical protein